jgi:trimeric autotransporter adhesin
MLKKFLRRAGAAWVAFLMTVYGVLAAEHRGLVQFGGLPVPGATVTATQGDKKVAVITDDRGVFTFPDLADGAWNIEVQMLCFEPIKRDVTVGPGPETPPWDLKALPVPVVAPSAKPAAPSTEKVSTLAGPAPEPPPATKGGFQKAEVKASAAGSQLAAEPPAPVTDANQTASDAFAINGSVNNGAASAFGQSGAFGNARRGVGGLIHGNLGFILDNSYLDARSYSLTGQDTPKPYTNDLQIVGNAGGLLRIPHLITSNNWNFFVGFQVMRNRTSTTQSYLVPTLDERAGDFSQVAKFPVDPATGAPFPGNVIPPSRISAQARALLNLYPMPNVAGTGFNYQLPLTNGLHQQAFNSRLNKSINQRNQVYGQFAWQGNSTTTPNQFNFLDTGSTEGFNAAFNYTHRFGQRVFTHFQYQFTRYSATTTPFFANKTNISGNAGITGNNQDPVNWGPPQLSFSSGITGLTDAQASVIHNQTGAFAYDTFWSHRSHNITWGADYKRQQFNSLGQQNPRGTFGFNGGLTGNDFADFLLGTPDTSSIAYGNADKYFRSSLYDAYFTDDWRAGRGFSVNIGGRWEYATPITELYGRLVNLDVAQGYSAVAPVLASHPTGSLTGMSYPDSLVHPDKHLFEPRIGVSWRPFPDSSMVVKGGYGIYANTSVYQSIASQMAQQSPLSKSSSVQNSAEDPLTLANGFNASPANPNTFGIDPNFKIGYIHNWQLSVQRDLPGSLVMIATYLGIKGTRGTQEFYPNTYPTGAANPCPLCPAGFVYMTSNGNSNREAGQFQLRRRLHNGFTATATYTYAKAIDDAALGGSPNGKTQASTFVAQNWLDLSADRALSSFDQRHTLVAQLQYSSGTGLKGGTLMGGWRGRVLKEWTFLTDITAATGKPETPVYPVTIPGTGFTGYRPDYTGAPLYSAPPGVFVNPAAFAAPGSGQWGNAGRNSITGPSQFTLNASLQRTFRVTDRITADFRFDSTNALNHVTFPSYITTFDSPQFGLPANNANPMRKMQATLRFRF